MGYTLMRTGRRLARPLMRLPFVGGLLALLGLFIGLVFMMTPLEAEQQAWLALGGFLVFLLVSRFKGRGALIFLVALSSLISLRYIYWRVTETLEYTSFLSTFLGTGLLLAEVYAVASLVLSYFQQIWPLERRPIAMPEAVEVWPVVDVFIPTYNEPLDVVKPAVFGAMSMDWPRDRMNVYILDDGRREEFRQFAEEVGCGYMTRPDNKGAKAGNINHALERTNGEYVAVFDCDHVPTRAFLQISMGWMLKDEKIAMLQTPHHFYSPDPFERNLASGKRVPNEGLLFYGRVQSGNDLWNAAFFCGSCAVMRRTALDEVGGVPTETVTEDCHCSLKMQRLGWRTAYLRMPLAAGLATDRLIAHIGQRMRWARGMIQILRLDNPVFGPGLKLYQRLCYLSAQWHFLFPVPRVVFLTAPLCFLLLGENIIAASPLAIVAYAGPHIVHSIATNSHIQGRVRHSFWSEIYETVLAIYLVPVVVTTLLDPSRGKFNVTSKGGTLRDGYFDLRAVGPNLVIGLFLVLGLMSGIHGMVTNPVSSLPFQANALNSIWVLLSLIMVLAGLAVGRERRQVRERARVAARVPAAIVLADGRRVSGESVDLSLGGAALLMPQELSLPESVMVGVEFDLGSDVVSFPAELLRWQDGRTQVRFAPRGLMDEGNIVRVVLGRADAWVNWDDVRADRPLRSMLEVALSIGGLFRGDSQISFKGRRARRLEREAARRGNPPPPADRQDPPVRGNAAGRRAAALLLAMMGASGAASAQRLQPPPQLPVLQNPGSVTEMPAVTLAQVPSAPAGSPPPVLAPMPAQQQAQPGAAPAPGTPGNPASAPAYPFGTPTAAPGTTRVETRSLRQLGQQAPMQLRGTLDLQGLLFGIRADEVVTSAQLTLQGATSPALIPELSQIAVTLNEQFVGAITPDRARPAFGPVSFPMNPVFFADANRLNFRFTGRYAIECNDPLSGLLWSTVSDLSTVQLTLERLRLQPDLARLPEPFFDPRLLREPLNLPMVLPDAAGNDVLRAAAISSSWFAVQADYRGANFPVSTTIPARGNAVVIAPGPDTVPGLTLPRMEGPTLAVVPNPSDPENGLLLVVGGRNGADAAVAAQALAVGRQALSGPMAMVQPPEVAPRQPYDAPLWVRSDRPVRFGELVDPSELQSYGFAPGTISIPFRTAPDIYTWRDRALPVDVRFRAPPGPITDVAVSRLDAGMNNVYLKSFPLLPSEPSWPWSWIARRVNAAGTGDINEGRFGLPPYLFFGLNDMQFRFDMRPLHRGDCISVPGDIRASIDPDSTVDLSHAYRFAELPNLSFFAGSGFPYTKLADFAGTAAVLPERPTTSELSAFFNLLGRMAANVGHAPTRIAIVRPGGVQEVADRDLMLIGALTRQPVLADMLRDRSPLQVEGNRITVSLPDTLAGFRNLFIGDDERLERDRLRAVLAAPGEGNGMLIGFQSPLATGRSVVALTGSSPQGVEAMVAALRDPLLLPRIQGDLAVISAGRLTSFKIGHNYTVGYLPPWLWPQYYLGDRPEMLLGLVLLAALLVAVPSYWLLRRRSARRLRGRV
jgi:cellulose synthase (UDP-forming)